MVKAVPKKTGGKTAKRSGTRFEHMAEDFFTTDISAAKRVAGSGAFGRISREPRLLGDLTIVFDPLLKPILAECKFGYGGITQITIKKEWIEKIIDEARLANKYPALIFKFKNARGQAARMIAFDWNTFIRIMRDIDDGT